MKSILVLAGSSRRESINLALANHAATRIQDVEITTLDLNDFEMPIFSQDREEDSGIPDKAGDFFAKIRESDGIILSLAEHNGSYAAAFKNLLDWTSRIETKLWAAKPMLLMATSPGGRGGATVLAAAGATFPHLGAEIAATFSLPSFYETFASDSGITDPAHRETFSAALQSFQKSLS